MRLKNKKQNLQPLKALKHLNKYLWKYRLVLLAGLCFIIITNILNITAPYLVRIAFDHSYAEAALYYFFKGSEMAPIYKSGIIKSATFYGALILGITLLRGFFMFLMRQTVIVVSRKIEFDLKNELYNHYQKMSMEFFRANFTGDLMSRLSEDVSKVRMYLGPAIMYFVNLVFTFITVLAMMISVNPTMTLYVLLPLPILSLSIYYVSKIINKKSEKIQKKLAGLTSFVQESMAGIRILKAFSVQHAFANAFEKETEEYRSLSMSLTTVNAFFMPLMMFLVGLSTLITVYFGGLGVINGSFTFGNIAEFVIYINLLTWPVASLGWVTAIVQTAEASQARINAFLQVKPSVVSGEVMCTNLQQYIALNKVSFGYTSDKWALQEIELQVQKGQTIGIVGPTGAGKTTLLHLIARFYDPQLGSVLIDGQNIKDFNLQSYRKLMSYVTQDVVLFSEKIVDNILFGSDADDAIPIEEVHRVAKIAAVHSSIMDLPANYETKLGERGINLSGGQKQRIALARALIRNPQILLMDDCLSAVDYQTEKEILQNLKAELFDRTAFVVSHRLSVVADADKILVVEDGRISAFGTHQDLLLKNEYYAKLYAKQMEEMGAA